LPGTFKPGLSTEQPSSFSTARHLLVTAERNHDFGYELMKRVAQVVIHRLQATRKTLLAPPVESALAG
jgi:hypothetical protein